MKLKRLSAFLLALAFTGLAGIPAHAQLTGSTVKGTSDSLTVHRHKTAVFDAVIADSIAAGDVDVTTLDASTVNATTVDVSNLDANSLETRMIFYVPRRATPPTNCNSSSKGGIYYDTDNNRVYYCDSSAWRIMALDADGDGIVRALDEDDNDSTDRGDSDLVDSNIKNGVNIFGVTGAYPFNEVTTFNDRRSKSWTLPTSSGSYSRKSTSRPIQAFLSHFVRAFCGLRATASSHMVRLHSYTTTNRTGAWYESGRTAQNAPRYSVALWGVRLDASNVFELGFVSQTGSFTSQVSVVSAANRSSVNNVVCSRRTI